MTSTGLRSRARTWLAGAVALAAAVGGAAVAATPAAGCRGRPHHRPGRLVEARRDHRHHRRGLLRQRPGRHRAGCLHLERRRRLHLLRRGEQRWQQHQAAQRPARRAGRGDRRPRRLGRPDAGRQLVHVQPRQHRDVPQRHRLLLRDRQGLQQPAARHHRGERLRHRAERVPGGRPDHRRLEARDVHGHRRHRRRAGRLAALRGRRAGRVEHQPSPPSRRCSAPPTAPPRSTSWAGRRTAATSRSRAGSATSGSTPGH